MLLSIRGGLSMLEKMGDFFNNRKDGYEDHQLNCIEGANEFLQFSAEQLPTEPNTKVLDLGCGTGLELDYYFKINPTANVTGIDLAAGMLDILKQKFTGKNLRLICGSYFDLPFEENFYDAAISVESLHHFTAAEKTPLYTKLYKSLKKGGYFVLTDYFAPTDEYEQNLRNEYIKLKADQGIKDDEFYHFDTPLTVAHEIDCLKEAGFKNIKEIKNWEATHTIIATK